MWINLFDNAVKFCPEGGRLSVKVREDRDKVYVSVGNDGKTIPPEELPLAVKFAHDHGVKVHVTVNTMPRNDEIVNLPPYLERLNDAGVDALIVADMGAFTLAGKYAPNCQRHISTQQSIANYECANAWYDLGAKRVVLARELNLEEIRTIREKTPKDLEIETFGHHLRSDQYVDLTFAEVLDDSGFLLLVVAGVAVQTGYAGIRHKLLYFLLDLLRPGSQLFQLSSAAAA